MGGTPRTGARPSLLLDGEHIPDPPKRPVKPSAVPPRHREEDLAQGMRLVELGPALNTTHQLLDLPDGTVELFRREEARRCHRMREVVPGEFVRRRRYSRVEEEGVEDLK